MKTVPDKPLLKVAASAKGSGEVLGASNPVIKLKTVTNADRQRLRILTYPYLLP